MKIVLTGTPGTGKTAIAKILSEKYRIPVINEKNFAFSHRIGEFNEEGELEIPIKEMKEALNEKLKGMENIILEGHLLCEMKLEVDLCIVITMNPDLLELRLEERNYNEVKKLDNVFSVGIQYCLKHAKRNYKNVVEVANNKGLKELEDNIVKELRGKKLAP